MEFGGLEVPCSQGSRSWGWGRSPQALALLRSRTGSEDRCAVGRPKNHPEWNCRGARALWGPLSEVLPAGSDLVPAGCAGARLGLSGFPIPSVGEAGECWVEQRKPCGAWCCLSALPSILALVFCHHTIMSVVSRPKLSVDALCGLIYGRSRSGCLRI